MSDDSPSSEKGYRPDDTLAKYEDGKLKIEHVDHQPGQRGHSIVADPNRNLSVATDGGRKYSTGGQRRLSNWEAMKVAKEGGIEIDEEIELLEIELRENPVKHSIFSPVINFKDPRHFTYGPSMYLCAKMANG